MGNVWDRTGEVLNGRGGMLAGIAILTLFVPGAINAAYKIFTPASSASVAVGMLLTLAATVAALWGQLAIIGAASDPATTRAAANRQASARLVPAVLVALVLGVAFSIAFMPAILLLVVAGFDFASAFGGGTPAPPIAPGAGLLAALYMIVVLIAALFLFSRLLPLYAVVLHERLSIGAIARTWRLTRKHTWRLVGVILLFLIVLMIATWAAQSVIGLVARLVLGGNATATVTYIAALAGQAVSTGLTLVAVVFSAQAYVALTERERLLRERREQTVAAT